MPNPIVHYSIVLATLSLLLCACSGNGVQYDPGKAHHGDGEFVSVKQGSFFAHYKMRKKEGDPPQPTTEEVASIVGSADLELINSPAAVPRVTWIGHATALVQYRDIAFLTDPHFSQYPFRFEFWVKPRITRAALDFEQLPEIDFVLISHNHYDSLDHRSVDYFGDSVTWYVPLGLKTWFTGRGISAERVVELDWWQSHRYDGRIDLYRLCVPFHHPVLVNVKPVWQLQICLSIQDVARHRKLIGFVDSFHIAVLGRVQRLVVYGNNLPV